MLAVSPLRDIKDERQIEMERFSIGDDDDDENFPDFSGGNFLDSIDFDDLFVGINDGDLLPDLEMDSEILAEFSLSGGEESFEKEDYNNNNNSRTQEVDKASSAASDLCFNPGEDVVSKSNESDEMNVNSSSTKESDKGKKFQSKNSKGKRKVKVDWTPELHRRFVQAVEQLGVDKAVPSRILEIMGIDCLTRHNIASHLQKYRSHKKHLLAREAEAASWNHRRQVYGGAPPLHGAKRDTNPWLAPIIGFPPMAPPMPHFRPLHVWGHPSVDQPLMHVWPPKHLAPSSPSSPRPPPTWTPHPLHQPPADPAFWHGHCHRAPNTLTPGTPCFAPPMAATRFPTPPVPGIPPPNMYKVDLGVGFPTAPVGQNLLKPPLDFEPSKESIDAAIGDVLSKPWLPLPLRLKPPSVDSVMVELQRQGISNVPPPCV